MRKLRILAASLRDLQLIAMNHIVLGQGGHARVIVDILRALGFQPISVHSDDVSTQAGLSDHVTIGIGDNGVRERLAGELAAYSFNTAIHPSAVIAKDVEIGPGTVVMAGCVINTGSKIGAHVILNTNSSIDHDCVVADFASVAPGVAVGGRARIGRGSAVGIGASVIHGCDIADYVVVGAGSVVTKSLPTRTVCYGVPARVIRGRKPGDGYLG